MEHTQHTATRAELKIHTSGFGDAFGYIVTATGGLLLAGSLALGVAFAAFRTNNVRAFDWRMPVDGRYGLEAHYGPVCRQLLGIPAGSCGDYVADLNEFSVVYYAPNTDQVLLHGLVPVR